ncbi:MAG TPA: ABC transporter permease [Elusimicrobiales bacterium]|nr:ABC transporter permease [Elusimicrobiales bacterium]HOL62728.1 ABC transporter permease [Elusimicrobiales bacterium]HPO96073.1 ABC transporter permease [Elusimicrobiales bacterium]
MIYTLKAELFKFYWDIRRYLFNYSVGIIAEGIFISGLYWALLKYKDSPEILMIGLIMWLFAKTALSDASSMVGEERYYGTFERLSTTKSSLFSILICRIIVNFIYSVLRILIIVTVMCLIFKPDLNYLFSKFNTLLFITFVFLIASMYSWGFIVCGLQIIWKKVGAIVPIIEYIFLVFSGIIVDVEKIPVFLKLISNIIPITWGLKILRETDISKIIVYLTFLIIYTIVSFIIGLFIFNFSISHTKKTGQYGFY